MKYIQLLRLKDQFIQVGAALASGLWLYSNDIYFIIWALTLVFLLIPAFILNEFVDRKDTDKFGWNHIYIKKNETFNIKMVALIFIISSFSGLLISYLLGLFWWALSAYVVGISYSLKPIRLKTRFLLDALAQLWVWLIVPLIAPIWAVNMLGESALFLITCSLIIWSISFPYQLAGFYTDKKGGIKGTHIVLGLRKSIYLGIGCGLLGAILFHYANLFYRAPWSLIFIPILIYTLFRYYTWLRLDNDKVIVKSMQKSSIAIKPYVWLIIPFFLIFYLF